MNKDINTMIELQRIWNNILKGTDNISDNDRSVTNWRREVEDKKHMFSQLDKEIKNSKILSNQNSKLIINQCVRGILKKLKKSFDIYLKFLFYVLHGNFKK